MQAALYDTLGGIYQSLGKHDRAESLLQSALEKRKLIFGADNPNFADSLTALAILRIDQAQFADAERLAREAVAIDERHLPADDPRLGNAMSSLGSVLEHRGKYAEAIKVLEGAVRIQSTPTAEPVDLVESLTYLANTQHFLGHDAIAESLDRRALALDRRIYGDRHPSVGEDLTNLGQIQEQIGLYPEAERNEREALDIVQGWYGKDHLETAVYLEGLAGTLICEYKDDEAVRLLQQALKTEERDVGKMHPFVALAHNLLGVVALRRGNLNEAERDFQAMAEIYQSVFGEKDRHVALGLSRFGALYEAKNEYPLAEQSFRESVHLFSETLSPDNVQTGTAQIGLGGVLLREKRYKDAETQLLAGYRIVRTGRSPCLQASIDARRDLVLVYEAVNAPTQAATFRAEQTAAKRGACAVDAK